MRIRVVLALWTLASPVAGIADMPQDFSGEWVLAGGDQAPGADSTTAVPHRGGDRSGGGGGRGMGGMGAGGHGMGGGGRHHSAGSSSDSSAAGAVTPASGDPRLRARALTIRQSDVVFDIAADGKRMVYRFDNRNNYGAAYGGTVHLSWAAPEMIIETHPDGGGSIEEHYWLGPDGKKLTLRIHEQRTGSDTARDVTREFVRGGAEDAAAKTLPP